jgi:hypothetical protein
MKSVKLCAVVVALLVAGGVARAQDPKAIKKIEDINRAAMEDYDLLEFESAKKQLNEALVLLKKGKMDTHAVAARTHMNLAYVYALGVSDMQNAYLQFMSALEIDPNLKIDAEYKTPELQKLFDKAKGEVAEANPTVEDLHGLKHIAIEDADGGKDIPITVKVGSDVKAKQMVLYFRSKGAAEFTPIVMKGSGADYAASIPADAVGDDSVHYYIEAKGQTGKVMASVATAGSPNIISITVPKKPKGPIMIDENPLTGKRPTRVDPIVGSGTGDGETTVSAGGRPRATRMFLAVGMGSGFGFVSGQTEVSKQEVGCCFAPAPLHILPEVGYRLSPQTAISIYLRLGLPLGANVQGAATAAPAGFARFTYNFKRFGSGLYAHGDLGGGFIRHTIKLKSNSASAVMGDTDTFVSGPLFVGGGMGYVVALSGPLRFTADANVLMGIPVISEIGSSAGGGAITPGFAINADLTLSLSLAF